MRILFVTGTDTEIGKTHVAVAMTRYLVGRGNRVAALKPVASGCRATGDGLRNDDALALMTAANVSLPYREVNPYAFREPIAPHLAAQESGQVIDPDRIAAIAAGVEADWLIVEGVGGWCVPLGEGLLLADLARALTAEVVVVVGLRLGCINHALLTAEKVVDDGFRLVGWVANAIDPAMAAQERNLQAIESRLRAPRLGLAPWREDPHGDPAVQWRSEWESRL